MSSTYKTVIKANSNPFLINWKEIWVNRELFYFLTWRSLKVRYKQTLLGILWIILRPLISMVLFTIVFGNYAKIPSDNIPYPIFVFIGLTFWNFFSPSLSSSSNSLVGNANIIRKIYFPRLMIPISATLSHVVDIVPTLVILAGLLIYYKVVPTLTMILLLPYLLFVIFITALGIGMILAPINAKYRDVRHMLPFIIRLGFFATPVIYPTSMFGGTSQIIRILNPVAEAIEVSRSGFFASKAMDWNTLILSSIIAVLLFLVGVFYFRTQEKTFVDIL
jgi:lipopolysaccharide transport system permease protein